jgi:hypothetical protein
VCTSTLGLALLLGAVVLADYCIDLFYVITLNTSVLISGAEASEGDLQLCVSRAMPLLQVRSLSGRLLPMWLWQSIWNSATALLTLLLPVLIRLIC